MRYSYVLNNPLGYVDASGFFFGKLFKGIVKLFKKVFKAILRNSFLRTVVAAGIAFLPGGSLVSTFLKGFGAGFVASGGDLKSGIIGALTFGVSHGVGTHFGNLARVAGGALNTAQRVAKILAHGVIGGISSAAHGGKFLSGFISAGTTQGFSQPVAGMGRQEFPHQREIMRIMPLPLPWSVARQRYLAAASLKTGQSQEHLLILLVLSRNVTP